MTHLLSFSVIVPTCKRPLPFSLMLRSLTQQTAQPIEMIVIDAPDDEATEIPCNTSIPQLDTDNSPDRI